MFLILDHPHVHHAKVVKTRLTEHKAESKVFYSPSYSPELNLDQYMNCDLRAGVHGELPVRTKGQLKAEAIAHLRKLQKLPGRVMKYFQPEPIRYAADA